MPTAKIFLVILVLCLVSCSTDHYYFRQRIGHAKNIPLQKTDDRVPGPEQNPSSLIIPEWELASLNEKINCIVPIIILPFILGLWRGKTGIFRMIYHDWFKTCFTKTNFKTYSYESFQ